MDGIKHSIKPIRLILANGPRLFREMLERVLNKQIDLLVVAEVLNATRLSDMIERTEADWVIVSLLPNGEFPDYTELLLYHHPETGILAVAKDGSQIKVKSHERFAGELIGISLEELLGILRTLSPTRKDHMYRWISHMPEINPNSFWKKARLN